MSKADFDAFVKRKQAEVQEQEMNAKQQLREWLDHLDDLYTQIRGFLNDYVDSGAASVSSRDIQLNEEFIGPYMAPELILAIGSSKVTFTPVGTMLIGAKGRVDVQGPLGKARLVLIGKSVTSARQLIKVTVGNPVNVPSASSTPAEPLEWAWKLSSPPPDMKFDELTQDSFFDLVLGLVNG